MSETFYIKTTAFDDIGVGSPPVVDIALSDLNSFIIGPGELNGPAGLNRDSDLELYGFGSLKWGEGVNQNQYRQLENFACPQKEDGDYWLSGSPPEGAYDSNIHPIYPKDEYDLGIGNGITTPIEGQNWYNTTDDTMYILDYGVGWVSNMTATNILDMAGYGIVNTLDPTDAATTLPGSILAPQDVVTVGWADTRFVNVTGDTMTGILNMGGFRLENVADPDSNDDAVNLGYADTRFVNVTGDTMTGILNMGGNRIENIGVADSGDDAMNRDTSDGRYVQLEATSFVNTTGTKILNVNNNSNGNIASQHSGGLSINQPGTGDALISFNSSGKYLQFGFDESRNDLAVGGGVLGGSTHKIWHEGNDGDGSGLHADLLDGYHGSSYLRSGQGYSKIYIHSPVTLIHKTSGAGTKNITYTFGMGAIPATSTHVLVRIILAAEYETDMRYMILRMGYNTTTTYWVAGNSSDDTDQGGKQHAYMVSEVWVPKGYDTIRWQYVLGGGNTWYTIYRIGYRYT